MRKSTNYLILTATLVLATAASVANASNALTPGKPAPYHLDYRVAMPESASVNDKLLPPASRKTTHSHGHGHHHSLRTAGTSLNAIELSTQLKASNSLTAQGRLNFATALVEPNRPQFIERKEPNAASNCTLRTTIRWLPYKTDLNLVWHPAADLISNDPRY